jgi:hypothetical protein
LPVEQRAALEERFRSRFDTLGRQIFGEPVIPVLSPENDG